MSTSPRVTSAGSISVIVPVLNEIRALPGTLPDLLSRRGFDECLVVDGGSSDGTPDYVAGLKDERVRLLLAPRGRGRQLNAGARAARGDCLLFHHADTLLPRDAFALIAAARDRGSRWGGFRHRFSEPNFALSVISAAHNLRCRLTGVVYGDQSMFAERGLYEAAGRFPEDGLEDLVFSDEALKQERSTLLPGYVVTDSRKFKQIGEWRALAQVISIVRNYERGKRLANERFFHPYR